MNIHSTIPDLFMLTWPYALVAVLYSLVRAKNDSYLTQGKWKTWSLLEGVLMAGAFGFIGGDTLLDYIFIPLVFGMWFWLFFDPFCGLFRKKGFFYIGSTDKVDYNARKIFRNGQNYFIFKLVWLIIISGMYESINRY